MELKSAMITKIITEFAAKKCFQETISKHMEFSIVGCKNNLIKNN